MPGMLPVINAHCVEQAVRTGLGLKAKINLWSGSTARTTSIPTCRRAIRSASTRIPIVGEGEIERRARDGEAFTVRIERLHLEQDAAKLIHDIDPDAT